jgi:hypothetical protein
VDIRPRLNYATEENGRADIGAGELWLSA